MKNLDPKVAEIAKNFMIFVESVRNKFQSANPLEQLTSQMKNIDSASIAEGWNKAAKIWPAIESPDNYFITMYTLLEPLRQIKKSKKSPHFHNAHGKTRIQRWFFRPDYFHQRVTMGAAVEKDHKRNASGH